MLSSISWNAVEFESPCFATESELLSNWALKWLDVDEIIESDEDVFGGYIHSVTYPEIEGDRCSFSVDFGSVSIDSFL